LISISLSGTTYYVATNGNDSNPGTISQPFASWQKGFDVAQAGDIVYIRGGTYYPTGTGYGHGYYGAVALRKNGTSENMINIWAYPGETPVLDCRNLSDGTRYGIFLLYSDYWYLKGLNVTRVDQSYPDGTSEGIILQYSNHNVVELCNTYENGGIGIDICTESEDNLVLNCDSYYNYDPYTLSDGDPYPGDNADGFVAENTPERIGNERVNTFRGCRAWDNGDDGFDFFACDGMIIIESCWAWHNGVIPGTNSVAGNSNGFKLGITYGSSERTDYLRVLKNCLAYNHRQAGFSQQEADVNMILYNNTAYKNGYQGFEFGVNNRPDILRNNISYSNGKDVFQSRQIHDHNSWDSNISLSDGDFISFDASQLAGPRKSDGGLPDITFLHLESGSDLIDKGTDIGLEFNGDAPDLGAFETGSGSVAPATPSCISFSLENASPSVIELTYNLSLAYIVPPTTAFSVVVNSVSRSINSVSVSGTRVLITLSSPVDYGNSVTVSYSVPSSNPLQTPAGGEAESFSSQAVENNINPPPAIPVYVSSSVENSSPSVLQLIYNLALASIVPATSAFSVQVNSVTRTVTAVSVSGTKVSLTISSPIAYGNTVTVSYTVPSSNQLQTSSGGEADAFSSKSVTNRVNPPAVPVYAGAIIENATPSVIEISYTLPLAYIVPSASAFTVKVNSTARAVTSVAVSGQKVKLTLGTPVVNGNNVTVAYTKPAANPLQTPSGGIAAALSEQTVTNKVNAVTAPPPVVTTSTVIPKNSTPVAVVNYVKSTNSGFVSELNASGSYDADKDNLTFTWKVPVNLSVSSTNGSVINYLAPVVETKQTYEFTVTVSDGKTSQSKTVPVQVLPYQPELEKAEVISVEASGFQSPNNPYNVLDGNIASMWSVAGSDQWIILELSGPFNIQHIELAFQPGQKKESYFEVFGSNDKINWEPILDKSKSCAFSGNLQVFDFPASKAEKEFRYVKLVGLGNSVDKWNYISEFRIFGYKHKNPTDYEELLVKIYPNPASEVVNILIDNQAFIPDFVKIVSMTGKVLFSEKIDPDIRQFQIPVTFRSGIYVLQMGTGNITMFTQKLIIAN